MENFKFYEVGGCVRDEILGRNSKDIDYVAVPNEYLLNKYNNAKDIYTAVIVIIYIKIFNRLS